MPPLVDPGGGTLLDRLAEQRRVLVSGPLSGDATTYVAAQLMALDGSSSRDIELVLTSPGGPLPAVFSVIDVLGLMRAKVNMTAIGSLSGTAVALAAACSGERRAAVHATFCLRLDAPESIEGTAEDILRHADELSRLRSRYLVALSAATGLDEAVLAVEIDRGGTHSAVEARALGIVDAVTTPS